ncbi:ATP-binding protein [Streptomyces collinus]|uniref:Kinase n=1 Tax=Streptomyces collinus TaxID=42684 RepID=A0AA89TM33_STRCU|nr:ATP-binding protein [Streptomyces collinus]MBB5816894.1 putative kinase [Streptomyces collinus]WMX61874.1 ATP-binding protein [Streptomyces collinus]
MSYAPKRVSAGLVILVGPPAVGKSTFVQHLVQTGKISQEAVASTDAIREELARSSVVSARDTSHAELVADERDRQLLKTLAAGCTALAESTNVTRRARARLVAIARQQCITVTVLRFEQSREVLFQQNAERERRDVSDAVVGDLASIMDQEADRGQLYADGAAWVHDVPGRGQGISAAEAAQLFAFNRFIRR